MSKKILITGFGPFPGVDENPCTALIDSLAAYFNGSVNGHQIECMHLETSYHDGLKSFRAKLASYKPDLTICFGVHGGADGFRLERVARNQVNIDKPDQAGYTPILPILEQNGPKQYESTLPLEVLLKALAAEDHQVMITEDAGGYLCNASFYYLMQHLHANKCDSHAPRMGGFIHIPQGQPDTLFKAAKILIKTAARNLT